MCKEYNGWKNYETWNVNLWLNNDEGTVEAIQDTIRGLDTYDASKAIEAFVDEGNPLVGEPSLYSDILNASIHGAVVDYRSIAEGFLEGMDEE